MFVMLFTIFVSFISIGAAVDPRLLTLRDPRKGLTAPSLCFNPVSSNRNESHYECPHKYKLDQDGSCKSSLDYSKNECAAYCEVRTYWNYGKEIAVPNSRCQGDPKSCQFGDTKTVTVTVTNTYSFDVGGGLDVLPKFKAAFNFGASFSFSESNAEAKAITQTKPDHACNYCGYWALIPYYITSCGSMSTAEVMNVVGGSTLAGNPIQSQMCNSAGIRTVINFCQTTPYLNPDGSAGGATIFVATDCKDATKAPPCFQDPIYLLEGVSNDADYTNNYNGIQCPNGP